MLMAWDHEVVLSLFSIPLAMLDQNTHGLYVEYMSDCVTLRARNFPGTDCIKKLPIALRFLWEVMDLKFFHEQ